MSRKSGIVLLCAYSLSLLFASFPQEFLPGVWRSFHSELRRFHRNLLMEPGMGVFKGEGSAFGEQLNCFKVVAHSERDQKSLYETFPNCVPPSFQTADLLGIMLFRALVSEPRTYPPEQMAVVASSHFHAVARFFCDSRYFGNKEWDAVSIAWENRLRNDKSGEYQTVNRTPFHYDCRKGAAFPNEKVASLHRTIARGNQ